MLIASTAAMMNRHLVLCVGILIQCVVYFDQRLVAAHSNHWSKSAFSGNKTIDQHLGASPKNILFVYFTLFSCEKCEIIIF